MKKKHLFPHNKLMRLLTLMFLVVGVSLALVSCNKTVDDPFIPPQPVETNQPETYDYLNNVTNIEKDQLESSEPLLDEEVYDAYYIITSPAEDTSTMVNINYMTHNAKTSVEYTKVDDENFTNASTVKGKCYLFEEIELVDAEPFQKRNVCRVTLKSLTPNTKYKYRVNKGNNTYSDEYFFTTTGSGDTTSFLFMTDTHYYHGFSGAEINEELVKAALTVQPNLDFSFTTGDLIDRGGDSRDWETFFSKAESLKYMPYSAVPGNHEYYDAESVGNKVFAAHFNFPLNGVEGYKGVSYYFVSNDTLFIQIDTETKYNHKAQLEWIERTIYNNPTKYIVVGTHAPFNRDNTDYDGELVRAMEKMGVDLVLTGHYHSHLYQGNHFGGKASADPYLGVTYLNGTFSAIKGTPTGGDVKSYARGYIVDVTDEQMTIRYINAYGTVLSTWTVKNQRNQPKETATNQELLDSIIDTYDPESATLTFSWSKKFYRNVKYMNIQANYRSVEREIIFFPTPSYTSYVIKNIDPDFDYSYTLTLYFEDGTTLSKTFTLESNVIDVNPVLSEITPTSALLTINLPPEKYLFAVRAYEVYLNGELRAVFNARDNNFNPVVSTTLTHLTKNTNYELVIKVYGRDGYMYHDTTSFKTTE